MSPMNRAKLASRYQSDGMAASSPQKLVVLMFERIESDLEKAIDAIERSAIEETHNALVNAQELIFELQLALDDDAWEGAARLRSIYDYLLNTLVDANLKKSADLVRQCQTIVAPLAESWAEAYRLIQQGDLSAAHAALAAR